MRVLNLFLLCAAILAVMIWAIPEPEPDCWLPSNAPTRGVYSDCWGFWDIWAVSARPVSHPELFHA